MVVFRHHHRDLQFAHDHHRCQIGEGDVRLVPETLPQFQCRLESFRGQPLNLERSPRRIRQQPVEKPDRFLVRFAPEKQGDQFVQNLVTGMNGHAMRHAAFHQLLDLRVVRIPAMAIGQPPPCVHKDGMRGLHRVSRCPYSSRSISAADIGVPDNPPATESNDDSSPVPRHVRNVR